MRISLNVAKCHGQQIVYLLYYTEAGLKQGRGGGSTLSTKLYTDVPLECVAFFSFHIYDSVVNYPPQHINGGYFYAKIHDTLYFYRCKQRLHCQNNTIILIFYNLA